jgi:hypothetical protein
VGAVTVKVQGQAEARRLDVQRVGEELELRGVISDDLGQPLSDTPVRLSAPDAPDGAWARSCQPENGPHSALPQFEARSDDQGRFCIRLDGSLSSSKVAIRVGDVALYAGTERRVALVPSEAQVRLDFDAPAATLSLDQARHGIELSSSSRSPPNEDWPTLSLRQG